MSTPAVTCRARTASQQHDIAAEDGDNLEAGQFIGGVHARIMSTFVTHAPAVELNHTLRSGLTRRVYNATAGGRGAGSGDGRHTNHSVVVIMATLSVVFILSGILHLLARCLGRRRRQPIAHQQHGPLSSAVHGQLQNLFHLHDAGVEQAFINTLPVFAYGSIRGLKDSADCAVCLNEFADDDRLRLLPKCKHAFHLECIDTWLLSHSTCPLCRRSLLLASSSSLPRHGDLTETATSASDIVHSRRLPCAEDPHLTISRSSSRITICEPVPPNRYSDNEIQEIHDATDGTEAETDTDLHTQPYSTPSPGAPTIRVVDERGTERVLKVELGRVTACGEVSRKLTKNGARSYSTGRNEYIVELTAAPAPPKPSHRSALSDSTPELASTPGDEERSFWNSRGHSLSIVRSALLSPIVSSDSNNQSSCSPGQGGDRWIDIDIERGEVVNTVPVINKKPVIITEQVIHLGQVINLQLQRSSPVADRSSSSSSPDLEPDQPVAKFSDVSFKQRSSSLGRTGLADGRELTNVRWFRRSLSETLAGREAVAIGSRSKDYVAKDVVDPVPGDWNVKQGSVLNWLISRDKRVVSSAASQSLLLCNGIVF